MAKGKIKVDKYIQLFISCVLALWVFLLPTTSFNVRVPPFRLTVADLVLLGLFIFLLLFGKFRLKRRAAFFMGSIAIFAGLSFFSIVNAIDRAAVIVGLMPSMYAILIIYCMTQVLKSEKQLNIFFASSVAIIIFSYLPAYLYASSGVKLSYFFPNNWRYAFLTLNPNQYSAFLPVILMAIVLMAIRLNKSLLIPLFLSILGLYPMLASGSRSGIVYMVGILLVCMMNVIQKASIPKRVIITTAFIGITAFALNKVASLQVNDAIIKRALFVFQASTADSDETQSANFEHGVGVRESQLKEGWHFFREMPFFGVGKENFRKLHRHEVHFGFISILFETGVYGFLGICIVFALLFYIYLRGFGSLWYKLTVTVFMLLFIGSNFGHNYMRQRWTWCFLGIIVVLALLPSHQKKITHVQTRRIQK